MLDGTQIRENLNKIITDAVAAYNNNKLEDFFEKLSKNHSIHSNNNKKCLIQYKRNTTV